MEFEVVFRDVIEANSEEEAYDKFLEYLAECVKYGDITTFDFYKKETANAISS
jgi:hypothetical protein